MSHGVLDDDAIDYKTIVSQRIEPFLHDLGEDCKKHPSVTFVSTTPGDIRRDPRTKSAIHRLSARIAALEEAESLIRQARLVAEEELALLRARVAPISACPNEIIASILVLTYSSAARGACGSYQNTIDAYLRSGVSGYGYMVVSFGERPETSSALRRLILRHTQAEALYLAVDNLVTLRLTGIFEEDHPNHWATILGSSDRLERRILSRLHYTPDEGTEVRLAIPVRTHLRSLVLGIGTGGDSCTEQYVREIVPMLMAFFRSSPLIQDLTIRMNHSMAIKILNALHLPHSQEALVSSENIYLPHLRYLEFHHLFYDHDETLVEEFHDELLDFLIFRSKVHWYDVESGCWQQKDGSKGLECLKLDSHLYEVGSFGDYVQDLVCIPNETRDRIDFMSWTDSSGMPMR
ncbi:hypothetical protein BS47DRAFT_1359049 [Hydnum rufescens UP504]|uniref:Uncharacterized protein n=1 Tax=Hydnum rufescens UP504 TaxID=1448309 RepID=A0A9P6DYB4_9AGAM|nr:hypothetical protein BS47DRAFT_1359049 [Hydnum rufescens UP504]